MSEDRRTEVVHVRCSPNEKNLWESAAVSNGQAVSIWIRELLCCASRDTLVLPETKNGDSRAREVVDSLVERIQHVRGDIHDVAKQLEGMLGDKAETLSQRLKVGWAQLYGVIDRLSG